MARGLTAESKKEWLEVNLTLFNPAGHTTGYSGITVELKGRPISNTENLEVKSKVNTSIASSFWTPGWRSNS